MGTYRWDKRREKKQRRKRFAGVTVFDAVLLFLFFCLGLWFFYQSLFTTLFSSQCMEQVANFGATATSPPILLAMYYVALVLFLFWCALLISSVRSKPTWWRFTWDAITGLSIIIICTIFSNFVLWGSSSAPDGTLAIGKGIWVTQNNHKQWVKTPFKQIEPEIAGEQTLYYSEYRSRQCVWLSENKITVGSFTPEYKNLNAYLTERNQSLLRAPKAFPFWKPDGFLTNFSAAFKAVGRNQIQRARDNQQYRPLTPAERTKFLEKQRCMKKSYETHIENFVLYRDVEEACDPSYFPVEPEDLLWGWH